MNLTVMCQWIDDIDNHQEERKELTRNRKVKIVGTKNRPENFHPAYKIKKC
jgi:hypothetical protein